MNRRLPLLLLVLLSTCATFAQAQMKHAAVSAALNRSALQPGQDAVVAVVLDIKPGFHSQSHTPKDPDLIALTLKVEKTPGAALGEIVYPPGQEEQSPALGALNIYTGKVIVYVPVKVTDDAKPGPLTLKGTIRYQICDDKACFAPESKPWSVETKVVGKGEAIEAASPELFKDYKPTAGATTRPATTTAPVKQGATAPNSAGPPPVKVDDTNGNRGLISALGFAFLAGILFNVVPCVLPMLPIKVLGFAEIAKHDRGKTVALASVFAAGIISVFAVLAVLILVLKKITWGQQFSNPYFAWGMVIVLLLLSLWLFGLLNVNLPSTVYAFQPSHETYFGNYLLGILTAILSTPCTGPLFPPVMFWAQSQPVLIGVWAMIMVGVGMAFPYVMLSAYPEAARKFPRTGAWADLFKQMLGFMLLAFTAFFAAGRFTTPAGQWWAVVPVAAMAAFYLLARTVQLSKEARPVGISSFIAVGIVTASVLVACRFSGVFDPRPVGTSNTAAVTWVPYSDETLDAARKAGRIVLVKFTANWCLNCQYVEATVYHDETAIKSLRDHGVVTLKADLTKDDAPGWSRLRELTATGGIPLTAIYVPGYDKPIQISSVYTTETLVKTLDQLGQIKTALAQ
jgi:thiol:disulfide interchange protein